MVQKSIQSCLEELQSSGDVDNGDALNREATSGVSWKSSERADKPLGEGARGRKEAIRTSYGERPPVTRDEGAERERSCSQVRRSRRRVPARFSPRLSGSNCSPSHHHFTTIHTDPASTWVSEILS